MQWRNRRQSTNVEDRRGLGGKGLAIGGGGIGTVVLLLAVFLCGGDPQALLDQVLNNPPAAESQPASRQPGSQPNSSEQEQFIRVVLADTEDAWNKILPAQANRPYPEPTLVFFDGRVSSACGYASAAVGPFYCPADNQLYLDFSFFRELKREFNAPGDFAQAYVIAHEVGHHVQNVTGSMDRAQGRGNEASVRLELQADCYAGIFANYARQKGILEVGDLDEALRAASAVGDDAIQQRQQGYVRPESFTHGTSKQRKEWFTRGLQTGDMRQCNTFGR